MKKSTAFFMSLFEQKEQTLPLKGQSPFIFCFFCGCSLYMKILCV